MSERADNGGTPLLEVRDLIVHHGQLRALDRVSLRVFPGEVYAIIGANGAGKSTLLRTIAGLHQPTEGAILYDGKNMTRVRPERRATAGIGMGVFAWSRALPLTLAVLLVIVALAVGGNYFYWSMLQRDATSLKQKMEEAKRDRAD